MTSTFEFMCVMIDHGTARIDSIWAGDEDAAEQVIEQYDGVITETKNLGKYEIADRVIVYISIHEDNMWITGTSLFESDDDIEIDPIPSWITEGMGAGDFYLSREDAMMIAASWDANNAGHPVTLLFRGPQGIGKTWTAQKLAERSGRWFGKIDMTAITSPQGLVGSLVFRDEETRIILNANGEKLLREEPSVILIDEGNRVEDSSFMNILNPALDHTRRIDFDQGLSVEIPINTIVIISMNIGSQFTGTQLIDASTRSRFMFELTLEFPPREFSEDILRRRYPVENGNGLTDDNINDILAVAYSLLEFKNSPNNSYSELSISLRELDSMGKALAFGRKYGLSLVPVIRSTILDRINDAGERKQIVDRLNSDLVRESPRLAKELRSI